MSDDGSDGCTPRPKRNIKKVMVLSSSSGSESDDSIGPTQTRKKKLRVISDDEAGSSSGSSVVCTARRKRTLPKLKDSDGTDDDSDWLTDHSNTSKPPPLQRKPSCGFASDSSEGNSDKCSICLMRFTSQEVGIPQTCEHVFCLDCITEWSKNVNTCPVDRITFDIIVVKACVGGRVLRTEPVKVVERRPSVDILVVEDPTVCEICGHHENEDTMLLCDGCDLGFHMHCLTPPLTGIPIDQWFCRACSDHRGSIEEFDGILYVDNIFAGFENSEIPLNDGRSDFRPWSILDISGPSIPGPSTSNGYRGGTDQLPTTSRSGSRSSRTNRQSTTSERRQRKTYRRKNRTQKRRRTKTVIIEYEVEEGGKFPVTKRIKRRVKKRKTTKRQPRTVARRTHVRASVRAKLAAQATNSRSDLGETLDVTPSTQSLAVRRHMAGITSLSLFGNRNELDYFSEDDQDISEGATTAVAARPSASFLSAFRQARRKMITIPSPPHASAAPDILSGILESQTLLHSKNSVVSIDVDGRVDFKVHNVTQNKVSKTDDIEPKKEERINVLKGEDATRKVPSYPGQSRGGGGWGGGYRGNHPREQGSNFSRSNSYDNNYSGGYQNRQSNLYHQNNSMRRDDIDSFNNYPRRPHQYQHNDDGNFDRFRRQNPDANRGPNFPQNQRFSEQGRNSLGSWQPYPGGPLGTRQEYSAQQTRHSFGGYDNPLDMRTGQVSIQSGVSNNPLNRYSRPESPQQLKPQPQSYQPLPEPPVFEYTKVQDVEKSEDEKSDSGLIIDTDKYDPTEPTNDDDSCDEVKNMSLDDHKQVSLMSNTNTDITPIETSNILPMGAVEPAVEDISTIGSTIDLQNIMAGIDTACLNVPPNVLDNAVRQVLQEHRNLIVPSSGLNQSDDESDGDCPNFSIYSATSVHIANNTSILETTTPHEQPHDNLEDLVQEDDDTPPRMVEPKHALHFDDVDISSDSVDKKSKNKDPVMSVPKITHDKNNESLKKINEEYKEKVSKRCPITTNTRNPIKIKLNTQSLIKKPVSLYDEEDADEIVGDKIGESISAPAEEEYSSVDTELKIIEGVDEINTITISNSTHDIESKEFDDTNQNAINEADGSFTSSELQVQNLETCLGENKPPSIEQTMDDNLDEKIDALDELHDEIREDSIEPDNNRTSDHEVHSEEDVSENESDLHFQSPTKITSDRDGEILEKMTESISETEDERSYTPCLDENKSKDTSMEKEKGIEGLDTEMISEDEGNEMFSDNEKLQSEVSPQRPILGDNGDEEIPDKAKEKLDEDREDGNKKKKRELKKDGKDKSKGKRKRGEIAFKKLSKSGKERNYRDKDKEEKVKSKRDRRNSDDTSEKERERQKRKEKRKDLERYDVRTVVTEKRRKLKDAFGRDISPRGRSHSASPAPRSVPTLSPRPRHSASHDRRSPSVDRVSSPLLTRDRRSPPRRRRRSSTPPVHRHSRLSLTPRSLSPRPDSPRRVSPRRVSPRRVSPRRISPRRISSRPSPDRKRKSPSRKRRKSPGPRRRSSPRRGKRARRPVSVVPDPKPAKKKKRSRSERPESRSRRRDSPRRKSPKRKKNKRRSVTRSPIPSPTPPPALTPAPAPAWSDLSVDSRLLSPRTPPALSPERAPRLHEERRKRKERRRDTDRPRHKRTRDLGPPSKEVFTSGDNILVSVSFADRDLPPVDDDAADRRRRKSNGRDKRKRRRRPATDAPAGKPVAIIDLERSPFRELTPSPKNVIVLSDSDRAEGPPEERPPPAPAPPPAADAASFLSAGGPKTPPEPSAPVKFTIVSKPAVAPRAPNPLREDDPHTDERAPSEQRGPNTPPDPPSSPDAYDPYEPTRSASASPARLQHPAHESPSPERPSMTLEAAQKTNLSADEVLDRRPLSPMEKVMALLQSTRDVSPEPPPPPTAAAPPVASPGPPPAPAAPPVHLQPAHVPPVRIVLPSPTRSQQPKLFLAKPSPIKSNPIKPMQATKISMLPLPTARRGAPESEEELGGESPYSPGSSDFGDLFDPPGGASGGKRDVFDSLFASKPLKNRRDKSSAAKVPVKLNRKKGKTQVGVKIDENNLKILDDLPSSAVEMQVKSKFLKKLNRQERVVEEVKLVLKPHYNKKRLTKEEYKDVLRRAVPKICHNKTGEINPTKIQALIEAYVKKIRKKRKLGLI